MKTLLTIILFCFTTLMSFSQDSLWLDGLLKMTQPDFHYCTVIDTSKISEDSIYLELLPPVYVEEEVCLDTFLKKEDFQKTEILVEISPAVLKYVIPKFSKMCYRDKPPSFLVDRKIIKLAEVPASYFTIKVKPNDSSFKQLIIKRQKIIQESTVKLISKPESLVTSNPILVIPRHTSIWKKLLLHTCCVGFSVLEVQEALLKAGYDCPKSGTIDDKTREALIKFQKANNLPERKLIITINELFGYW